MNLQTFIEMNTHKEKKTKFKTVTPCTVVRVDSKTQKARLNFN